MKSQLTEFSDSEPIVIMADAPVPPPSPVGGQPPGFDKTKLILPGAIILAALIISGSILFDRLTAGKALIANAPAPGQKVAVNIEGSPMLGDAKAPVTVVEFGDFQCPYCQRYFQDNEPALVKDYVNTGKVKFVWKDYSFLGDESTWAAEAARCANEQGKFWAYHDYLYSHQGAERSGAFAKPKLKSFAQTLGLDTSRFNSCLDSDKYAAAIGAETQYGNTIGVTGTPASFVNGILVSGAVPYSDLKAAIDSALKK